MAQIFEENTKLPCEFCKRDDAATTARGLARHRTMCKVNPANIKEPTALADRIRQRADAKLAEAERLVQELATASTGHSNLDQKAHDALDAFGSYRELIALLGAA